MALADVVALSTDYQTWLALDYPLMAIQKIPLAPTYYKWVDQGQVGAGSITSWVDRSGTATPARFAFDGYLGYRAAPSGTTDDVWYYCIDLGAEYTFDSIFALGHNFGSLGLSVGAYLEVSDTGVWDSTWTTIGDFSAMLTSADKRLYDLSLTHGANPASNVYTQRYLRLVVNNTGGGNIVPQLGELILASRYQMSTNPQNPWDKDAALHDEARRTASGNGVTHTTYRWKNQHILNAPFKTWETARIADFKAWFQNNAQGSFVWIDEPSSAPDQFMVVTKPTDLDMPSAEFTERSVVVSGVEQGPSEYFRGNE